ncbi:suppressor protein SRP40 [Drosophila erecta]|uniref:GG11464 n=1 Tax=Drosophila erecta TaxID=7220 RepID=B3P695_DROER|nr:suppressor protein SRP40 [Drosophila erecta]EDV53565.1 uncharacterized protein Dere_GG11464 [Drosophila erecta]
MAPTICSEKKQLRETRRHHGVATAAISSASTTASTTSTTSSSSSSSSSTSLSAGSTSAAAATQATSVLNHVAKGSMNSMSRRRQARMQRRMPNILARVASFSTDTSSGVETEVEMDSEQRMQLEEERYSEDRIQDLKQKPHSSSDNIKTVLQPTTASGFSSKQNRSVRAKKCDREVPLQVEDDRDGDSGYEYSQDPVKEQHLYHRNSEGLLSIAIKTIKLVQRNQLLQKRLAELQLETSEFIASVLANPENRQFRDKMSPKADAKVSSMLLRH